jgi:uncharacterized protein (TIGR02246 family)
MSAQADDTSAAIRNLLQVLGTSFRMRDARSLLGIYAEDADWTNAFGTTLKGRQQIADYLTGLFADPHFGAGQAGPPKVSIRPVTADVVVVKTYIEIEGQQALDGTTLPTRRNHSLKVIQRQPERQWLIVSDIYMDARTEETYRGSMR